MILFITTMLIWWCIHFAHYYLGKRIITGISEEKLVEIMSSPLYYREKHRPFKKQESRLGTLSLIMYIPMVWIYTLVFKEMQRIILPTEGVTFTGGYVVLPAMLLAFGTIVYAYFRVAAYEFTPIDKWISQPTLQECQIRIAKLKRIGIRWSLFCQFLFLTTMLFYTNIGDNGVKHSGFFNFSSTTYPYSDIEEVTTCMSVQKVSSKGTKRDDFVYHYVIRFDNRKNVELWDGFNQFGWNQRKVEKLKQATYYFRENNTSVIVDYPSFLEWAKYKRLLSTGRYQKVKNYFDDIRGLSENVTSVIPMGENITIDSVIYRIDSVTTDGKNGIFAAPKNQTYLFIHMTAHNDNADSSYVNPFGLELYDKLDSTYRHSIFANDTFKNRVPPNTTQSGSFGFNIPTNVSLPLRLRYQDGFLDKRYYWFELMDSTDIHLLE